MNLKRVTVAAVDSYVPCEGPAAGARGKGRGMTRKSRARLDRPLLSPPKPPPPGPPRVRLLPRCAARAGRPRTDRRRAGTGRARRSPPSARHTVVTLRRRRPRGPPCSSHKRAGLPASRPFRPGSRPMTVGPDVRRGPAGRQQRQRTATGASPDRRRRRRWGEKQPSGAAAARNPPAAALRRSRRQCPPPPPRPPGRGVVRAGTSSRPTDASGDGMRASIRRYPPPRRPARMSHARTAGGDGGSAWILAVTGPEQTGGGGGFGEGRGGGGGRRNARGGRAGARGQGGRDPGRRRLGLVGRENAATGRGGGVGGCGAAARAEGAKGVGDGRTATERRPPRLPRPLRRPRPRWS